MVNKISLLQKLSQLIIHQKRHKQTKNAK